jgi:DNA polymerase III epsilon subunit-like protein
MNEDLLRFKNNQKYLIFDYETCNLNLNSQSNKPWQIGYLIAQGKKILDKKDFYISWNELNISKEAARITGFSKSKYEKKKVDAESVLNDFEKYLYDDNYLVIGHNILGFDVYIHNIFRNLLGKATNYSFIDRCIDTNCLARSVKNEIPYSNSQNIVPWQYKLLNFRKKGVKTNLKQLCKDYSIDFDESKLHDALYDVIKTYEVFLKMIWDIEI